MEFQQRKLTFHGFIIRRAGEVSHALTNLQSDTEMEIEPHYQKVERENPIERVPQVMEEEDPQIFEEEAKIEPKLSNRKGRSGRKHKGIENILSDLLENKAYKEWLRLEFSTQGGETKTLLYCEWCRTYEKQNALSNGILFSIDQVISPSFNACRLIEHCKENKKHKEAKTLAVCKKLNLQPKPLPFDENITVYDQMFNLMEFIQISLKKDLSINSIVDLVQYFTKKGTKLPKHYTCFNSIKEVIILMGEEYQNNLVQKIKGSPFFSIAIDSSTDISKTKSLCINLCYLDNLETQWSYFDSIFLQKFDSQSITEALINLFDKFGIDWQNKPVAYCSDGEPTVRSSYNGVYGILKRKIGTLVGIHCIAHSFALTHKTDLSEKFPILDELFQLTYQTYKYFNNSSRRIDQLFEMQVEIEDLIDELNFIKPIKVRWLSLFNAITRVVKILRSLIQTLEKWKNDLTVKTLLTAYTDPRNLSWLHFLSDIASDIKLVTEVFQEKNFNMKKAIDLLNSVKANLKRKYIDGFRPGYNYTSYLKKIIVTREKTTYENIFTLSGEVKTSEYEAEYKKFCESLIESIDKRFENFYGLSDFIFFYLNFLKKNLDKPNIIDEAQKGIPKLLKQLNMKIDVAQVCNEYAYLVEILRQTTSDTDNNKDIYGELMAYYENKFPLALKLMAIYKVLPLSNVECERTFSRQNRIKTKLRSLIEDQLLSSLLKLGVSLEYTSKENNEFIGRCIMRWKKEKKRYFFNDVIVPEN